MNGSRGLARVHTGHKTLIGFWAALLLSVGSAVGSDDLRLIEAVKHQDHTLIRRLLDEKTDVRASGPDGATALHWAVYHDDLETVRLLIRAQADVQAANDLGVVPLSLAATNGSAAVIEALLTAGAKPNAALPSGETVLLTAARTGRVESARVLLDAGANIEAKESSRGQTALMWAASEQHLEMIRLLIERGADIHGRSNLGYTALLFGSRGGDIDVVRLLLAHGAGVNDAASDGTTALLMATVRGHIELAELLLDQGADPNVNAAGYTPLHWAAGKWETQLTQFFDPNPDMAVLSGVAPSKKLDFIKALLTHGADPNIRIQKQPPRYGLNLYRLQLIGSTPFLLAAHAGDTSVMRLLLANGADPLLATNEQVTPLMVAAGNGRSLGETVVTDSMALEAFKLCLALGADVNAVSTQGETALHAVAFSGIEEIARMLLDLGVDLNPKNKRGETPLKVAEGTVYALMVYSKPKIAELLRQVGAVSQ